MSDTKKLITLVAAMGRNRAIGLGGKMPWHLSAELKHFKATTMGKPIVMGRKTWESIGRPLPGRQNIVVSRQSDYAVDNVDVASSVEQAITIARGSEVMIIGGGQLYTLALPMAGRMVLTQVDCEPKADTWFPQWSSAEWIAETINRIEAGEGNQYACEMFELRRTNMDKLKY